MPSTNSRDVSIGFDISFKIWILKDGEYGALVPVGDPDKLAGAIIKVLKDGGIVYDWQLATERFKADHASKQYFDLIKDLG